MQQKSLFLFLLLLGLFNNINSQWTIKNINETSYSYDNVIKFKDDSIGLFMGDNSTILKTEDVGETWIIKELDTKIHFKDFQFINDSIIYSVGDSYREEGRISKLIKSQDIGNTWDSISSFNGKQIFSLWFFSNDSGMVAGYDGIYRTNNSGNSWDTVWSITQFGYKYGSIEQLYFPTTKIGYAIGKGRTQNNTANLFDYILLKSIDSGLTWDTIKTFQYSLTVIHFINHNIGFIGTNSSLSTILKTIDGGDTWNETQITNQYNSIKSIFFTSNMTGFATGAPSSVIPEGPTFFSISKTINGGDSWESYDTIGIPLNSIYYIDDTIGFVSGSYNLIMKSSDRIIGLPENYPWHLVNGSIYIDETDFNNSQIIIYPNPTNGILNIKHSNCTQDITAIKIISATGKIIENKKPQPYIDIIQLDLSDLASGIYLIQVIYSDRNELLKVLKR